MIDFLQNILRIESRTYAEGALAAFVVDAMRARGFDAAWVDETGNALGLVRGRERGAATMLLTHLDHIDVGDLTQWRHPPFAGEIENGVVYGRGAVDIKGPLAAHVFTLVRMLERGVRPRCDVLVTIPIEEEVGGRGMVELLRRLPLETPLGGLELGACVVGEPSGNRVMLGHRGVNRCTVYFHGRAHHASLAINQDNPHFALAEFIKRLERVELPMHPILGGSSITPTVIHADTASNNLTPNTIKLTLDWRTVIENGADVRTVLTELTQGLPATFVSYDDWQSGPDGVKNPGFVTAPDHPLVMALRRARDALLPPLEPGLWKFATDGRHAHALGIACVGFGPGLETLAHTTEERIDIAQLEDHVRVLGAFLESYATPSR
jgi:succinyl-diaminopimelate desuccinylase